MMTGAVQYRAMPCGSMPNFKSRLVSNMLVNDD
jgi:hypothetical protein